MIESILPVSAIKRDFLILPLKQIRSVRSIVHFLCCLMLAFSLTLSAICRPTDRAIMENSHPQLQGTAEDFS